MIQSVTVTNYVGDSLEMVLSNPQSSGFNITSIEGLGPVESTINTVDLTTVDGAIFSNARSSTRNIVMNLAFYGDDIESIRHKSYRYFPIKQKLDLLVKTDRRSAKISGYVEKNEPAIFSEQETAQISIICPSPWFHTENDQVTGFSTVKPLFEFPFSNESLEEPLIQFGEVVNDSVESVIYEGDIETGFVMNIHVTGNEIGDITIRNYNTRETMVLDVSVISTIAGGDLRPGDDIYISTVVGDKYVHLVREGVTYNILNCIGRNADWFVLRKGENRFLHEAETGETDLWYTITNPVLYEGV